MEKIMIRGDQLLLAIDLLHYINSLYLYCIKRDSCYTGVERYEEVPDDANERKFSKKKIMQRFLLSDNKNDDSWEGLIPSRNCNGISDHRWIVLKGLYDFLYFNQKILSTLTLDASSLVYPDDKRALLFRSIASGELTEEMLKA